MGAAVAHLAAVRGFQRWQFRRHLPRGGVIAGGGCAPVERLRRPRMVALFADVVELRLLGAQVGAGRSGGVGFQGARPALVTTVLWGGTGFHARRQDAPAPPPGGPLGPPGTGVGGERHAVIGANPPRHATFVAHTEADGCGLRDAWRGQGGAATAQAAVAISHGPGIAGGAVTGLEGPWEVRTPHVVRRLNGPGGGGRMPAGAARALLGPQAMAAAHVTAGGTGRPGPAGRVCRHDGPQLLRAPGWMLPSRVEDRRPPMVGRVVGRGAGPTGARFAALRAVREIAVDPVVAGRAADAGERAECGH